MTGGDQDTVRSSVNRPNSWTDGPEIPWASVVAMHRSRVRAVMIDVPEPDLAASVAFWAAAIGRSPNRPASEARRYLSLLPHDKGIRFTFQRIDGPARFHLDIETDDVEAEVRRLEAAGGQVVGRTEGWVVLQDPAGLLLCVIPVDSSDFDEEAAAWPD
jgi:predicted enzyme related to lactoylglutathione lyase